MSTVRDGIVQAHQLAERRLKGAEEALTEAMEEHTSALREFEALQAAINIMDGVVKPAFVPGNTTEEPAPKPRKVKPQPEGPYASYACKSCGEVGTQGENIRMVNERPMRFLTCRSCRTESPLF